MANLVLVHGAWMGAWCWKRVVPRLRDAGHEVYTPTLTGLGELSHLLHPETDLNTHVHDIVNFLDFQDLQDVVLVAHSYAGMATGLASHQIPDRIGQLIYVDAFVPENGKSFFDLQSPRFREEFQYIARSRGDGWKIPPIEPSGESLGVSDPNDVEWLRSKMTAHPIRTLETPAIFADDSSVKIPRTYIFCNENPPDGTLPGIAKKIREQPDWKYFELKSPHAVMITAPAALAGKLLEAI